ncbi:MAG: hypothetical protein KF706_11395 [Chitinophagales bacterium]|nr:hypothetical protein [Chitinophagales bacterium]
MGQRVEKEVIRNADTTKTLYVHDASGNIMAIYTLRNNDTLKLNEVPLYGSSRLGVWNANKVLRIDSVLHETEIEEQDPQDPATEGVTYIAAGEKQYELSNHLGNVLATVSDRKIPYYVSGALDHYKAEQITGNEYYAFGMTMPQRTFQEGYRFGFGGGEKINEIYSKDNYVDLGERGVDVRLGRLNWRIDPLAKNFPSESNYTYAGNNPIIFTDYEGKKKTYYIVTLHNDGKVTVQTKVDHKDVRLKYYNAYGGATKFYSADVSQTIVQTENGKILHESNESFSRSKQNYFVQKGLNVLDRAGITDGKQAFGYDIKNSGGMESAAAMEIKGNADIVESLDLEGMSMPNGIGKGLTKAIDKLLEVKNAHNVLKGLPKIGVNRDVKAFADVNSKSFEVSEKIVEAVEFGKKEFGKKDEPTDSCTYCHKVGTEQEMKSDDRHFEIVKIKPKQ